MYDLAAMLADEAFDRLQHSFAEDWDPALRGNVRRGGWAESRLWRIFRGRGYDVARQLPVVALGPDGTPEAGRIDVVPLARPGMRPAPAAFESKAVNLARYRLPGGGLDAQRLRRLVDGHVTQALNYQQGLGAINYMRQQQGLPPLPERVRLIYQVPQSTPRADAIAFQRLALGVSRPRGVRATVIMPGTRASRAFEE